MPKFVIIPEKMPIRAPAKISAGQWTPTKTRETEIITEAIKNHVPIFLSCKKTAVAAEKQKTAWPEGKDAELEWLISKFAY